MSLSWCIDCVSVFLVALFLTALAIPRILAVAFKKRLFDEPDERKIHRFPIPRLGGLAFKPAIVLSLALTLGANILLERHTDVLDVVAPDLSAFIFASCALLALYIVGVVDDLVGVGYRIKFVVQILAAFLLMFGNVYIHNLYGFLGVYHLPLWVAYPLTLFVVVFVINAINLIDGVDGLAAALSASAFIIYGVLLFLVGKSLHALVAFASVGALVAYFYFNVFGSAERKSKILMGDTGSMSLGFILSFLAIELIDYKGVVVVDVNVVVLAFSPLLIPCFDVVRVFINRVRNHKNPFLPDKTHIHHRLLALGFSQRVTMSIIVFSAIAFSVFNFFISLHANINLVFALDVVLWVALNTLLSRRIKGCADK